MRVHGIDGMAEAEGREQGQQLTAIHNYKQSCVDKVILMTLGSSQSH